MPKNRVDVYTEVTNKVIASLESGTVPWHKPWQTDGEMPRNLLTGKPYRGINVFLLGMSPYASSYWMTYKQAAELGYKQYRQANKLKDNEETKAWYQALPVESRGGVRKGEKATMIVFWNMFKNKNYDPNEKGSRKVIPMLRYYNVFNVEQMDNIDYPKPEARGDEFSPVEEAERILASFEDAPNVVDGNRASYSPVLDTITLPVKDLFDTPADYYSTRFHESIHSTGHSSRLSRPEVMGDITFGNDRYSKEELVAEMGAAMLNNLAGIESTMDNSAAYIKSWISKLENDPKLLISAAGKAQRAADFVQGFKHEDL